MNEVQIFENERFGRVRTIEMDGEPWFVGKDVASALGYKDTSDALKKFVDDSDKLTRRFTDSGQSREMYIINESGLYSLIFGSKLDSAKEFKRWVTHDVLPSIRRTGSYAIREAPVKSEAEISNEERSLRIESAKFLRDMARDYADFPDYKQVLDAYAVKEVVGTFVLPLPESRQEDFSAGELGKALGVSASKIGAVANKLGLKTDEYGHWVIDKSPYSAKQVRTFRYYGNALDRLREGIATS